MHDKIRSHAHWGAMGLTAVLFAGCGHAKDVEDRPSVQAQEQARSEKEGTSNSRRPDQQSSGARKKGASRENGAAQDTAPTRDDSAGKTSEIPVVQSPEQLVADDSMRKIQSVLQDKGFLAKGDHRVSGKLDGRTEQALLKFQRERNLPATGIPDRATAQALGLDSGELFEREQRQHK